MAAQWPPFLHLIFEPNPTVGGELDTGHIGTRTKPST